MSDKTDDKRGGKRAGAGRKKHPELLLTCGVKITPTHMKLLKLWGGGNVSAGLRWLVDAASQMVRRVS